MACRRGEVRPGADDSWPAGTSLRAPPGAPPRHVTTDRFFQRGDVNDDHVHTTVGADDLKWTAAVRGDRRPQHLVTPAQCREALFEEGDVERASDGERRCDVVEGLSGE